jgi:hypothetical protein
MRHLLRRDLLLAACAAPFALGGRPAAAAPGAAAPAAATAAKPASAERKLIVENLTRSFAAAHAEMVDLNDVLKAFSKLEAPTAAEAGILAAVQARLAADDAWLAAITRSGFTGKS